MRKPHVSLPGFPHACIRPSPVIILLLLFVLSEAASVAHAQTNMLSNAGFESPYETVGTNNNCPNISGKVASGWEENTCWVGAGAKVAYRQDTSIFHGGLSAQRVTLKAGQWQLAQWIPLSAARVYIAKVWLRSSAPMQVTLSLRQADEPYTTYVSRIAHVTAQWKQHTLVGRAEATTGAFLLSGASPGTLWIDDASLTMAPVPAGSLPTSAVPRSYFGMHYHKPDTPFPRVNNAVGAIRIWDAEGCQWAEVNPAEGVYEWSVLDTRVNAALKHHANILMSLGRTPRWASARPNEPSPYGPGQSAEPANDRYWSQWVTAVGRRYKGKIKYWEIWNEPNETGFYSGSITKLISLARRARAILKAIDPGNQLVTPSAVGDIGWLGDYFARGGGTYADIVGYHFYLSPGHDEPELLYDAIIPNVQSIMQQYHQQNKPLWDTEAGWLAPNSNNPLLPDETAVGYMGRRYVLAWARGVKSMYFYAWDNHGGVMSVEPTFADNVTLTPAGIAYRSIAEWLSGAVMGSLTVDRNKTWIVQLKRPSGIQSYIVWNTGHSAASPLDFTIPATWNIHMRLDLDGGSTPVGVDTPIDGRPTLLEP